MTRFRRERHDRINRDGSISQVRGHEVDRTEWARGGRSPSAIAGMKLFLAGAAGSYSARFVNPNAVCPECDEPVFYYQNEFGSRVFFDELGPPWPKHPCTDNKVLEPHRLRRFRPSSLVPTARPPDERADLLKAGQVVDRPSKMPGSHAARGWQLMVVRRVFRRGRQHFVVAERIDRIGGSRFHFQVAARSPQFHPGAVVARRGSRLSFMLSSSLVPETVSVTVIQKPADFIDLLPSRDGAAKEMEGPEPLPTSTMRRRV